MQLHTNIEMGIKFLRTPCTQLRKEFLKIFSVLSPSFYRLTGNLDTNMKFKLLQMSYSHLGHEQFLTTLHTVKDSLVLAKRLLGADSALAPRSLLPRSSQHQTVFWPDHTPIAKVPNFITAFTGV